MTEEKDENVQQQLGFWNSIYPEAEPLFTFRPKRIEEIKDECYVVLDTGILLVPYRVGPKSLEEIRNTLESLASKRQLIVPGQVAREFAKHRSEEISNLHNTLFTRMSKADFLSLDTYPLLEGVPEYLNLQSLEVKIKSLMLEYRENINKVLGTIRSWNWNDPVASIYGRLFTGGVILDVAFDQEEIKAEQERRRLGKIPPGYKDKGEGDLLVWRTILELGKSKKRSVLFISLDKKADWSIQSAKQALYPRFELVDEFRRASGGQTFQIIDFSCFLELYGASQVTIEEVKKEEVQVQSSMGEGWADAVDTQIGTSRVNPIRTWLQNSHPLSTISGGFMSNSDYTAEDPDGHRIGVWVHYFLETEVSPRLSEEIRSFFLDVNAKRTFSTFERVVLVMVAVHVAGGWKLFSATIPLLSSIRDATIVFGHYSPRGDFVPLHTII